MKGMGSIAILVVAILIIGSVFAFQNFINEESTEFGSWGQQIYFEFEDGSSEPLGGSLLSFIHEDKTVISITYILSAKATGTGYDTIEIDLSNYALLWIFTAGTTGGLCTWQDSAGAGGQKDEFIIKTVNVNGQWDDILNIDHPTDSLIAPLGYGFYTFKISPSGSIRYRADGGIWVDVPLPSKMSADVEVKDDRTLIVDFDQGTYYDDWEWELTASGDGWNEVTFTQAHIDASYSNSVEDVFESVIDYLTWVFYTDNTGTMHSWVKDRDPGFNDLTVIVPGEYQVYVSQDCTLTINKC